MRRDEQLTTEQERNMKPEERSRTDAAVSLALAISALCEGVENGVVVYALAVVLAGAIVDTGTGDDDEERMRLVNQAVSDAIRKLRTEVKLPPVH